MQRAPQEIHRELQDHRLNNKGPPTEKDQEVAQIDQIKEQETLQQTRKKGRNPSVLGGRQ